MNTAQVARKIEEIKADPMATAEEVQSLAIFEKVSALAHPNCPAALWWELAAEYPVEAQASVLYPMLTLESPGQWDLVMYPARMKYIEIHTYKLPGLRSQAYKADLEQYLANFAYPTVSLKIIGNLRNRVRIRRMYAKGEITEQAFIQSGYNVAEGYWPSIESILSGSRSSQREAFVKWAYERLLWYQAGEI